MFLFTAKLFFSVCVCWLNQKKTEKRSNRTNTVYGKLNFYRGIKGLYNISTNVAPLLIIKQGHRPMFVPGRQEASWEWVTIEKDFVLTKASSRFMFKAWWEVVHIILLSEKGGKKQVSKKYVIYNIIPF